MDSDGLPVTLSQAQSAIQPAQGYQTVSAIMCWFRSSEKESSYAELVFQGEIFVFVGGILMQTHCRACIDSEYGAHWQRRSLSGRANITVTLT